MLLFLWAFVGQWGPVSKTKRRVGQESAGPCFRPLAKRLTVLCFTGQTQSPETYLPAQLTHQLCHLRQVTCSLWALAHV